MTELAIRPAAPTSQALSLAPMTPPQAWKFAEWLADTPLMPDAYRNRPASVLWALEYGRALGLDVVTTITTIHVIKGKPTQSADLMLSRARTAGHRVRIKPERTRCVVKVVRADDPEDETEIEWTLDDAVTARLCEMRNDRPYARDDKNRPTSWEKYPRAMLRSRAIAEAVRTACPEVLHGAIYTPEELGAEVDADGEPTMVAEQAGPAVRATQAPESQWETPAPTPAPTQDATSDPSQTDWIAEAKKAATADVVANIHAWATRSGASEDVLAEIVAIGTALRKKEQAAPSSQPPTTPVGDEQDGDGIVDAEVVTPTQAMITEAQSKRMHALFRELEITTRDVKLHVISRLIGAPISSSSELVVAEASDVIDALSRAAKAEDNATALHMEMQTREQARENHVNSG